MGQVKAELLCIRQSEEAGVLARGQIDLAGVGGSPREDRYEAEWWAWPTCREPFTWLRIRNIIPHAKGMLWMFWSRGIM